MTVKVYAILVLQITAHFSLAFTETIVISIQVLMKEGGKEVKVIDCLDLAQEYADKNSGCKKVAVGSLLQIKDPDAPRTVNIYGCNRSLPVSCRDAGCRRIDLYGEDSKGHRLPSDCRSLHSEIDALTQAARWGYSTEGATLYITRYPCEACARAIVNAGVAEVYYGREQTISEETEQILLSGKVKVTHVDTWSYEDTRR